MNGNSFQSFPGPGWHAGRHATGACSTRTSTRGARAGTPTLRTAGPAAGPSATAASSRPGAATTCSRSVTSRPRTCRCTSGSRIGSSCATTGTRRVLGPTFPNREYLMSGQSGGNMTNAFPTSPDRIRVGQHPAEAGARVGVTGGEYYGDLPMFGVVRFADASVRAPDRELPRRRRPRVGFRKVSFITPSSLVDETRTDDHPHGDPRAAQRFVQRRVRVVREVAALAQRVVHPHLRRVGRVLRPRRAAALRRRPGEHERRVRLRSGGLPGADDHRVAARVAVRRRSPAVRPHVDPAVPRVALPRRAAARRGWLDHVVVDDSAIATRATWARC